MTEGLLALHQEGLLHLDLKPDNVMVDREGAIRILDFGLVIPLNEENRRKRRGIGGTPRYMAPERLSGLKEATSADWYSLGVMLAEQLGAEGGWPSESPTFPSHAPQNLVDVCLGLLRSDPGARLSGPDVAERLGAKPSGTHLASRATTARPPTLVGRDDEFQRLEEALTLARNGGATWVRVTGESGIGKSVLLRHFRQSLRHEQDVTILEGTCYERELMPFQGLDGILEDLAAQFVGQPSADERAAQILFEHASSLSDAFRDLCRGLSQAHFSFSPIERRRAAFSG
jgi:serine/threonine protein kinase